MSKETKYIAFDTETEMMSYTNPLPEMMCLTYAEAGEIKTGRGSLVTPWEHPVDDMVKKWWAEGTHTIGHNMAFDESILAFNYDDMMPHIFDALDKGLIHDTMIREKLLNITLHGSIKFIEINGVIIRCEYSLAALEKKYLNIDRSDLKDDPDAPRTNYHIYKGVPANKWGEKFISYAVDDAINTGLIFQEQEKARADCIDKTGYDPFVTEIYKNRSAWALRLLECAGTRLDPEKVIEIAAQFDALFIDPRLIDPLNESGFRTPPLPAMPYAKGTLDHTEECNASTDSQQPTNRKNKLCGCPVKMKKAEPEHSPKRPLHQHIWNIAGDNPDIEAWANDSTRIAFKKEGIWKQVTSGKKFTQAIIQGTEINAAMANIEANISECIGKMDKKGADKSKKSYAFAETCKAKGHKYFMPDDVGLTTAAEWSETFADRDPLLAIWHEREGIKKIVNEYLPKMYYTDEDGNSSPAKILRASYGPIVLTGRSHSWASSLYPSRSDQTVDPRVRPCTIPREGNVIVSTDYNGMELGTLAQKCIDLFGYSELAEKINAGVDTHAYLAAQMAYNLDTTFRGILDTGEDGTGIKGVQNKNDIYEAFKQIKKSPIDCLSEEFCKTYIADQKKKGKVVESVSWGNFYKHYRTLAKPVGLGLPGMLGIPTMCSIAKSAYGVEISKDLGVTLKEIWLETYPEMGPYLDYVKKQCFDTYHMPVMETDEDGHEKTRKFYVYDTPRGMHRSKCGICEAANGGALQAPSAEGALDALYEVQKACWLAKEGDLIYGYMPTMFIHDEIVGESPDDDKVTDRVQEIERIMVECMMKITPNVLASAESASMRRWNKYAEPVWDNGKLVPWEPKEVK